LRDPRLLAFVEECNGTARLTAFKNTPNLHHLFDTLEHPHIQHAYQVAYRTCPRSGGYMYFYIAAMRSVVTFLDDFLQADDQLSCRYAVFLATPMQEPQVTPGRRRRSRSAAHSRRAANAPVANGP
jgi:hypothetical protein